MERPEGRTIGLVDCEPGQELCAMLDCRADEWVKRISVLWPVLSHVITGHKALPSAPRCFASKSKSREVAHSCQCRENAAVKDRVIGTRLLHLRIHLVRIDSRQRSDSNLSASIWSIDRLEDCVSSILRNQIDIYEN